MRPSELEEPDFARSHLEQWLPDHALRKEVLTCLGESVRAAHAAAPQCWGLSLLIKKRLLRLNVGMVNMFVVGGEGPQFLLVDRQALPEKPRWKTEALRYKNAPSADGVLVPSAEIAQAYEQLRDGHVRAIHEAARRRTGYIWSEAHSPGLLAYMRGFLETDLPDPDYEKPGSANSPSSARTATR